jgi:hypothetical protein
MRDIGGVEIPESLAKLVGDDPTKADGNGRANGAELATASEDEPIAKAPTKPRV